MASFYKLHQRRGVDVSEPPPRRLARTVRGSCFLAHLGPRPSAGSISLRCPRSTHRKEHS